MLLALLLALLVSADLPLLPADTTDTPFPAVPSDSTSAEGIEVSPIILLDAFYSPTRGFGLGVGVGVDNLIAPGTEFAFTVEPAERFLRYRASFFTGDPFRTPLFAGLIGQYESSEVRAFYGLGPNSSRDDKLFTDIEEIEGEVRLGWYPLGTRTLLLQPVARLLHTRLRSFRDRDEGAFLSLDPASQQTLFESVDRPATGVTYGLELAVDRRDRLFYSTRGALVLLTARRYDGLGDNAFRYATATGTVYGFLPLFADRHVLMGRAVVALTRQIGDAPIPFYALPTLDDRLVGAFARFRFNGNDLVVLTAAYRFPIFDVLNWFALDGTVAVSAANAYDDVFEQARFGLSFDKEPDERGRTPLRPAVSLGLQLVNLDKDRVVIGGQLGFGPEGYRVGSLRLVYGIRDVRPVVR